MWVACAQARRLAEFENHDPAEEAERRANAVWPRPPPAPRPPPPAPHPRAGAGRRFPVSFTQP
jgi:hypothetical protein